MLREINLVGCSYLDIIDDIYRYRAEFLNALSTEWSVSVLYKKHKPKQST
jgi:hypothetical protein